MGAIMRPVPLKLVPTFALVAANLFPLAGVLWLGWDTFTLLFLFWLENVVIGFFNALRMATAQGDGPAAAARKVFLVPFFLIHYGGFTLVHGVFLFALFHGDGGLAATGPAGLPGQAWAQVRALHLGWSLLALFLSHGVSFAANTLQRGEYRRARLDQLMAQPYRRVIIMHLTVLLGGLAAMKAGDSRGALVVLVLLKLGMDLRAHAAERKTFMA